MRRSLFSGGRNTKLPIRKKVPARQRLDTVGHEVSRSRQRWPLKGAGQQRQIPHVPQSAHRVGDGAAQRARCRRRPRRRPWPRLNRDPGGGSWPVCCGIFLPTCGIDDRNGGATPLFRLGGRGARQRPQLNRTRPKSLSRRMSDRAYMRGRDPRLACRSRGHSNRPRVPREVPLVAAESDCGRSCAAFCALRGWKLARLLRHLRHYAVGLGQ
jgi:hypothetical protein